MGQGSGGPVSSTCEAESLKPDTTTNNRSQDLGPGRWASGLGVSRKTPLQLGRGSNIFLCWKDGDAGMHMDQNLKASGQTQLLILVSQIELLLKFRNMFK